MTILVEEEKPARIQADKLHKLNNDFENKNPPDLLNRIPILTLQYGCGRKDLGSKKIIRKREAGYFEEILEIIRTNC